MTSLELLKDCNIITTLTNEEQKLLSENMTKVQYAKGERIIKNGEFASHVLYLAKGFVKIHSDFRNKTIILNICSEGSFPGLATMIGVTKHSLDITAIDDSLIYLVNIDAFRSLIETNGQFALHVIQSMNDSMLEYVNHNLISLSHNNIHGRLANLLLYLSENVFRSVHFDLMLSRRELSQFSNISRENVIKVLYEFDKEGIIRLNSKTIHILKPEQLRHYAEIS